MAGSVKHVDVEPPLILTLYGHTVYELFASAPIPAGHEPSAMASCRLRVLVIHLLKWRMQPSKRSPSWRSTILTQRQEIADLLQQSPSLRAKLSAGLATNYGAAVARAAAETRTEEGDFPRRCPFTIDQILDRTFLP